VKILSSLVSANTNTNSLKYAHDTDNSVLKHSCDLREFVSTGSQMANRDFLEEFAQIFYAFKQEHDLCDAQISVHLNSLLSVDLCTWFTKYFKKERHRLWLEQVCHLKLEPMRNGVRHLLVTEDSFFDLANVALLTGLDDVYMHRSAFTAATASMVAPAAQPSSLRSHCVGFRLRL